MKTRDKGTSAVLAAVLAAGSSSRMGEDDKLLVDLGGVSMIRRVVDAALKSQVDGVLVVVRANADAIRAQLPADVTCVVNESPELGLSSSLRAAVSFASGRADGLVVLLGDMPWTKPEHIDALIDAFEPGVVCVPVRDGRRGNPVLWGRDFFPELKELTGDRGARSLLERHEASTRRVVVDTDAIFVDIDTPLDLARARGAEPDGREAD